MTRKKQLPSDVFSDALREAGCSSLEELISRGAAAYLVRRGAPRVYDALCDEPPAPPGEFPRPASLVLSRDDKEKWIARLFLEGRRTGPVIATGPSPAWAIGELERELVGRGFQLSES